tara:strand:- start:4071 stop:4259 length:189 start_codon:yes stop_codon:yes gene_type:complete
MSLKQKLIALGYESAHLDDVVHDAASTLASNANNDGMGNQIEFLTVTCGWSEKAVIDHLEAS